MKPEDKETQNLLFDRMKQEFGERGAYAVEMLQTAERLLGQTEQAPQQALAAAYCIRQAVVEIFGRERGGSDSWRAVSRDVVEAKRRYGDSPNPSYELPRLLSAVDRLAEIHDGYTTHQGRIREAIKYMTGGDPLDGEGSLSNEYQELIERLNKSVHDIKAKNDAEAVSWCYDRAVFTLARILLPSSRREEIDQLAELDEPQRADARSLKEIMVSPNDFYYFAKKMKSASWFEVMDRDMLRSPSDSSPWLVRYIVSNLKDEHLDAFLSLVNECWGEWIEEDAGPDEIGFIGFRLGDRGLPLLVKALEKKPEAKGLCSFAVLAYSRIEPSSRWISRLADILLNPDSAIVDYDRANTIPARLVDGMDRSSSEERIGILVFKLAAWESRDPSYFPGAIADADRNGPPATNGVVHGLRDALKKGRDLGMPTPDLVGYIASLPGNIRSRLEAWLYGRADDVDCPPLVDFVVSSCRSRRPTGDDFPLLDRLGRLCAEELSAKVEGALGRPPDPEKAVDIMRGGLSDVDSRRILWAATLGDRVSLPGWEPCLELLRKLGLSSDLISQPAYISMVSESPFGRQEFDSTDPYAMAARIAAWRPDAERSFGSIIATDIAYELEDAVKRDLDRWAEDPVRMIGILQHPTYVACYFKGLARSECSLGSHADKLIRAARLAAAHPRPAFPLDPTPFGYDPNWHNSDDAGIELIRAIAKKNAALDGGSLSDAWELALAAATGHPASPKPLESADPKAGSETHSRDHLQAAINRPRTSALETVLDLIRYVKNGNGAVPVRALEALTGALRLAGQDGAEHRAILASRTVFLRSALPDWFEQNERFLFGKEAPGDLAQVSLDMHLKWDHPDGAMLEKYRDGVFVAVERDVKGAMDRLLLGMLWGIDGYDPKSVAARLAKIGPKYVSLAGENVAAILSVKENADRIPRGVRLWECVLDSSARPEALAGYGRWADVAALDQELWESLTLRTCEMADGRLDWAGDVAERIGSARTVTDTGLRILRLLVRANLDYLDEHVVAKHALNALNRSKDVAGVQESRNLLRDAVWERGFHQDV